MALAIDDIIEVSFRGTLFGQRILSILHYTVNVTGAGNTLTQLDEIAGDFALSTGSVDPVGTMLACQGAEYTLDIVRTQRVYPTRTIYTQRLPNLPGTNIDPCTAPNVALSITKRSETPGRKGIGRIQLGGIPASGYSGGAIDTGGAFGAAINAFRNALSANFTTSVTPLTLVPVIFNPTGVGNHYSLVSQWIIQDTLRTMHRRTLFLGE